MSWRGGKRCVVMCCEHGMRATHNWEISAIFQTTNRQKAVQPVCKLRGQREVRELPSLQAEDEISRDKWDEDQCNRDLFKLAVFNC